MVESQKACASPRVLKEINEQNHDIKFLFGQLILS